MDLRKAINVQFVQHFSCCKKLSDDFQVLYMSELKLKKKSHPAFSRKGQIINVFGFVKYIAFIVATQVCSWNVKTIIDNMQMNR